MSLEGHFCWEDCDEGPHGCICGNDCAPPHAEVPADNEREALVALIHDIRLRPVRSQMDEPFADAILAAGWRRQAPPTEAVLEAAEAAAGRFFAPRPWWMKNMVRAALEAARNTP